VDIVIVTRHEGIIEWLNRRGIIGEVKSRVVDVDIMGKEVYGRLPIYMAALAFRYYTIAIPYPTAEFKINSQDTTADDMDDMGARLESYSITRIE